MRRREGPRQSRRWEEYDRFEEVESEDDYGREVGFHHHGEPEQAASDKLYTTGTDRGFASRHRKTYDSLSGSDFSDDNLGAVIHSWDGTESQDAMRDKEEQLVRKAMERIRRAQMLGRTRVRLTQPELDALERNRLRAAEVDMSTDRRGASGGGGSGSGKDRHSARSGRALGSRTRALPEPNRRESRSSSARQDKRSMHLPAEASFSGVLPSGSDGLPMYTPPGVRGSPTALPSASPSRSASRDDQHAQRTSSAPQYQQQRPPQRYSSAPGGAQSTVRLPSSSPRGPPRPLPDEPAWLPRVRAPSSAQTHVVDPFQYQTYSPPALHVASPYLQERRNVSGPPDIQSSSVRRVPANPYVADARMGASSSDPALSRLQPRSGPVEVYVSEGDEDYDDLGNDYDIQVDEMPVRGSYFSRIVSPEIPGGRQRKGRR